MKVIYNLCSFDFYELILFLVEIEKSGSSWDNPRIEKKHLIERSHP